MNTSSPTHISQVINRIKFAWADMDHAQRRLFEIRTGIPVEAPRRRRATIDELEELYHA